MNKKEWQLKKQAMRIKDIRKTNKYAILNKDKKLLDD